jgi:hypothetical protein
MTNSFLWIYAALVLMLTLFISPAQARCALPCGASNPDIFPVSLPKGESYDSFYSWLTAPSTGIFAEGTVIASKWVANNTVDANIHFLPNTKPCAVNITFVSSVTSARNRIGWFQFNKNGPRGGKIIAGTKVTMFEDATKAIVSGETEPCLYQGSTVTLGPFSPSISIGFYLDTDGRCLGANGTRLYSLDEENLKYDTTKWNPTTKPYGRTVAVVRVRPSIFLCCCWLVAGCWLLVGCCCFVLVGDTSDSYDGTRDVSQDPTLQQVFLGFDDNSFLSSDQDYNDVVLSVSSNCSLDTTELPCYTKCRYAAQVCTILWEVQGAFALH